MAVVLGISSAIQRRPGKILQGGPGRPHRTASIRTSGCKESCESPRRYRWWFFHSGAATRTQAFISCNSKARWVRSWRFFWSAFHGNADVRPGLNMDNGV